MSDKPIEKYPAIQKAFLFIKGSIDNLVWKAGERLPSIKALATSSGVSMSSVIKAVALLRDEGIIVTVERGGIRVNGADGAALPSPRDDKTFWRHIRELVEEDILSGTFAQEGLLPNSKDLEARYGVCFRTMQKVVRSLAADKVVERREKRLWLPATSRYRQTVVFITHRTESEQQSAVNRENRRIVDVLESECVRLGWILETMEVDFYNAVECRAAAAAAARGHAMGFVLDVWWYVTEASQRLYLEFLESLVKERKPVAALDELGNFGLPAKFSANPLIQVFTIEGSRAGETMAGFLLGLGHRSVLYLSTSHAQAWSRDRLDGLRSRFVRAGFPDAVKPIVDNDLASLLLQVFLAAGFTDDLVRKLLTATRTQYQVKDQFETWLLFKKNPESMLLKGEHAAVFRRNLTGLKQLAKLPLDKDFFEDMCIGALKRAFARASSMVMEPLFKRALACHATAWICANDGIALPALAYARRHGVAVPRDLSIVGYDNEPVLAAKARLTSYDFNAQGFAHRMLNFIARPPRPRGPYRHCVIEVDGMVVERGTAGRRDKGIEGQRDKGSERSRFGGAVAGPIAPSRLAG